MCFDANPKRIKIVQFQSWKLSVLSCHQGWSEPLRKFSCGCWSSSWLVHEIYIGLHHVSDQASHFKKEVIAELNSLMQTYNRFTTAYVPQANETVEKVDREIPNVLERFLSELRMSWANWLSYCLSFKVLWTMQECIVWVAKLLWSGLQSQSLIDIVWLGKTEERRRRPKKVTHIAKMTADLLDSMWEFTRRPKEILLFWLLRRWCFRTRWRPNGQVRTKLRKFNVNGFML